MDGLTWFPATPEYEFNTNVGCVVLKKFIGVLVIAWDVHEFIRFPRWIGTIPILPHAY